MVYENLLFFGRQPPQRKSLQGFSEDEATLRDRREWEAQKSTEFCELRTSAHFPHCNLIMLHFPMKS